MQINVNETITAQITVKDANGSETVVATCNATLDKVSMNVSKSVYANNVQLATQNAAAVKTQYDEFEAMVIERATALGIIYFTGGIN